MKVVIPMLCSKGNMGSGTVYFLEDFWCSANLQSTPGKGHTYRFATFPFVLQKVNVSARLTRSPEITRCPMWLLASEIGRAHV